jgi:adenosylcobinamide-phosphate synthase
MIFFALLVATLLDYNVPFAYEKRLNPYVLRWTATAQRWTSQQAGWVDWAVGVGLPVIATAVIFLALSAFASVLAWVWLVVVLYVFSGYGQFKDHMSPVGMFGRVSQGVADEGNNAFDTPAAVRFVLHRVVGYWVAFIVLALLGLGPAGAVLYRLAREKATPMRQSQAGEEPAVEEQAVEEQAVEEQAVEEQPVMQAVQIEANESTTTTDGMASDPHTADPVHAFAALAWHWVGWLPARAMVICAAMVGAFDGAIAAWREPEARHDESNDALVVSGVLGSLGEPEQITPGMVERLATRLLWLIFVAVGVVSFAV